MGFIAASATFPERVPVCKIVRIEETSCFFLMTGFYLFLQVSQNLSFRVLLFLYCPIQVLSTHELADLFTF